MLCCKIFRPAICEPVVRRLPANTGVCTTTDARFRNFNMHFSRPFNASRLELHVNGLTLGPALGMAKLFIKVGSTYYSASAIARFVMRQCDFDYIRLQVVCLRRFEQCFGSRYAR